MENCLTCYATQTAKGIGILLEGLHNIYIFFVFHLFMVLHSATWSINTLKETNGYPRRLGFVTIEYSAAHRWSKQAQQCILGDAMDYGRKWGQQKNYPECIAGCIHHRKGNRKGVNLVKRNLPKYSTYYCTHTLLWPTLFLHECTGSILYTSLD